MKQATRDGILTENGGMQERILAGLYGTVLGRILLKPLTAPWISRLAGAFLSTKASCFLIRPFIRSNHIDMSQFEDVSYQSYNDFFSRKIRPDARVIDQNPEHLISPCDCKLTAYPITPDCSFTVKHTSYTVSSILKDDQLAQRYNGGYALVFRLCVDDSHRYCYVADGTTDQPVRIPGVLHTVNPIANDHYPIYKENAREYSLLHTDQFGDILVMEVGALMVGKIVNHPVAGPVNRGQEKGYFQFGGSTIVLLLGANRAVIDHDILSNSQAGIETVVRFGEKIGIRVTEN